MDRGDGLSARFLRVWTKLHNLSDKSGHIVLPDFSLYYFIGLFLLKIIWTDEKKFICLSRAWANALYNYRTRWFYMLQLYFVWPASISWRISSLSPYCNTPDSGWIFGSAAGTNWNKKCFVINFHIFCTKKEWSFSWPFLFYLIIHL